MRLLKFVSIIFAFTKIGCQQPNKELKLQDDEVGLIGYCSLTSIESMEETLERKYNGYFDVVE